MSLEQDIRAEIENIKKLKLEVGKINNHLSSLEGLCRQDKEDAYKRGHDDGYKKCLSENDFDQPCIGCGEYQRGYEDGKASIDKGCEGCKWESKKGDEEPCKHCRNEYYSQYKPMPKEDDSIKVGDEVRAYEGHVFVVTGVTNKGSIYGIDKDGMWMVRFNGRINKTGRHFDISSILEAMHNVLE